jgi:ubiquinone biosynthesis monooxygenase Coq7
MSAVAASLEVSQLGSRILKVNHAGENGAVHIYAGQLLLARLTAPGLVAELAEFKSHEERHRTIFWAELERRGKARCRSYLLCGIGGYALGLVTGLFGMHAIAATTVAVERVVLRHLQQQLIELQGKDDAAQKAIAAIVAEEQQHHDQSAAQIQSQALWLRLLAPIVAASTEAVIWVGMRV